MVRDRFWWFPLIGVLFIAVIIAGFTIAGEPPDIDKPAQEAVDFYVDNRDAVMISSLLECFAAALFVMFGAYLRNHLRATEGVGGTPSLAMFAGTIVLATGLAFDATLNFTLAETADEIDPTAVQALLALWHNDFLPFALGAFLFLGGLGVSVLRYGGLPKWIGFIAIALALTALTPAGFVAVIGAALLVGVIGVILAMQARSGTAGRPATAP